jgi:hypothetical protein
MLWRIDLFLAATPHKLILVVTMLAQSPHDHRPHQHRHRDQYLAQLDPTAKIGILFRFLVSSELSLF